MDSSLTTTEVKELVAERAMAFDRTVTPEYVDVYEDPHSLDGRKLIVEIAAIRPEDSKKWAQSRLRLSQQIRDKLLERGDDRYPVLLVFTRDEWPKRHA